MKKTTTQTEIELLKKIALAREEVASLQKITVNLLAERNRLLAEQAELLAEVDRQKNRKAVVVEHDGQFLDSNGRQLLRCWGSGEISDIQLRGLKVERTTLTFPGGVFFRCLE